MVRILRRLRTIAATAALICVVPAAIADAEKGADSFDSNCAECHSVSPKLKNKKGPTLFGIVGRKSASIGDYEYSDAMKAAGYAWDTGHLDAYIAAPKKAVPGGKMKFDGVPDDAERRDLIEFLSQQK